MILITAGRTKAFARDERQILTARAIPSASITKRDVERARNEIWTAMRSMEADPADWSKSNRFTGARELADFIG